MIRLGNLLDTLSTKPWIIGFFILCALPAGLFMALLTPAGQAPDEPAHMARAAGLLHGAVLAVRKPLVQSDGAPLVSTGVKISLPLFEVAFRRATAFGGRADVQTEADADAAAAVAWSPVRTFAGIPNTATYFPVFYLPATAGLAVGRLVGFSPLGCMLTARVFMLGAFLLLGSAALWLAAFGEALLLLVLLLPMTLFLAGTLNPDGMLAASACLAAAALTRGRAALAMLMLALIVMAKLPYIPLLGVLLLPLAVAGFGWRLAAVALAAVPPLVWAGLIALYSVAPFGKDPYHPGPLFAGNRNVLLYQTYPADNLHILLAHPALLVSLPVDYLTRGGFQIVRETIGILGLLGLRFPDALYQSWLAAFFLALLAMPFVARPVGAAGWLRTPFVLGLVIVTFWAIAMAMYLNWSYVGDPVLDGLQGRYYIPLLPFLLLAVPALGRWARLPAIVPALPVLGLGLFDLGFLPQQLVAFFYLH